ncbi:hypothetical protein [Caldimonas brevitalea]|uniref:Uncharacterized protein n=1 Tax=Caldimonas brevitalea TaxID=413882 RepID=A0A0G3BW20_9BURK|nr:hypothetical protein [Caldimonas brevitalea]AKJ32223.1 hypothetical protein AAW51_5532 [Caldimonas brevitalea]
MSDFYAYFKQNMDSLGLPAPESLFGQVQQAVNNTSTLLAQVDRFGTAVTLREISGAGSKLEVLSVLGGFSAAFYVGAVIGSLAVATGRSLAGGTSLADVLLHAAQHRLHRPWLISSLQRWPGLYDAQVSDRHLYRYQLVTPA